jgi:hypothetical protein
VATLVGFWSCTIALFHVAMCAFCGFWLLEQVVFLGFQSFVARTTTTTTFISTTTWGWRKKDKDKDKDGDERAQSSTAWEACVASLVLVTMSVFCGEDRKAHWMSLDAGVEDTEMGGLLSASAGAGAAGD